MNAIRAELLKLRRSSVWVAVLVVPLMAVITGATNTAMNPDQLSNGWESLWGQVTLFYGFAFFSVGIAVIASAGWRMEHRGGWHLLGSSPVSPREVVGAKLAVLAVAMASMQLVLLALTWLAGIVVLRLSPAVPAAMLVGTLIGVVAGLAVLAAQSLLSMLIRSFAAPVVLSLVASIASIGLLYVGSPITHLIPQVLVLRSQSLTSSAFGSHGLTPGAVVGVVVPALVLTVALTAASAWVLERRDVRA